MPLSFLFNPFSGNFDEISQVALTNVGSSPNAQAASLDSNQNLTLQPADGTNPGILTAIAQNIGGVKTLLADINVQNVLPSVNNTYNLGSLANQFHNIWAAGTSSLGNLDSTQILIGSTGHCYFGQPGSKFLEIDLGSNNSTDTLLQFTSSGVRTITLFDATDTVVGRNTSDTLTNKTFGDNLNMNSHKIVNVTDPTAAQDAATKNYVDNVAAGINPAVAVQAATTASSDTSGFSYNNGVSGIGAFFTGGVNTPITFDGYTFTALGQRALIKNDTHSPSGAFNGVYYVTQLQTALLPPILTRALDYDQPSDINNTGAIPVINGAVNTNTSWVLTSQINTVGTDPLTYVLFTRNPSDYLLKANNLSDVASKPSSFNNISPMTTLGDTIYGGTSGTGTRLPGNTTATKNFLTQTGTGSVSAAPAWGAIASGDLPSISLTSDVTGSGSSGSIATTIANNVVSNAKFRQSAALSVVGNSTNATANVGDIAAASDNQILRRSGTSIAFGSIDLSQSNSVGASILAIANGGTGQSSANSAFNALAPSQGSNSGKFLTTDGTNTSWAALASNPTYTITAGENLTANQAIYICNTTSDASRTVGRAYKLDVTNYLRYVFAGFVTSSVSAGGSATIQVDGELSGFTGVNIGRPIYASTSTPGGFQTIAPLSTSLILPLGIGSTATTKVLINGALFNSYSGTIPINSFSFGYLFGGYNGGTLATVEKLTFSNESNSQLGTSLGTGNRLAGCGTSATRAYLLGGVNSVSTSNIEYWDYAGVTSGILGSTLASAISSNAANNSSLASYTDTGGASSAIYKLTFSGETTSTLGATMPSTNSSSSSSSTSNFGYWFGGYSGGTQTVINKIAYSGETTSAAASNLSTAIYGSSVTTSSTKMYVCGGDNISSVVQNIIQAFLLADETTSLLSATLSHSLNYPGAYWSSTKGYVAGGSTTAGGGSGELTAIDALTFATETRATIGATLGTGRDEVGYGYN